MSHWLLKTEPSDYAYDDLVRDKRTVWDGVGNALALQHIRKISAGDLCFIYHTGNEKAVVGIAKVIKAPYSDPAGDDSKMTVIDLKPMRKLANPVTLAQIKTDPAFQGWDLIRNSRLSAMPVPTAMWIRIETLSEQI